MRYLENVKLMNSTLADAFSRGNVDHLFTFPQEITVTALLKCNYRCRMCYQNGYEGELDWRVLEKIAPLLPFARTFQIFGGEPLLYPRITELYRLAHENGCAITSISNGSLLSERMCREIVEYSVACLKFSIDAGTPATYRHIRGGDFAKVMEGVARIHKLKQELGRDYPVVDFNFLAMRSNVSELPRLLRLASRMGVRAINVFYPSVLKEELVPESLYFHQEYGDEWLMASRELAAGLGVGLVLPTLFRDAPEPGAEEVVSARSRCQDPWTKLLVDVDGSAKLCCAGPTGIGNLNTDEFDRMWNGETALKLRRTVNTPNEPGYCKVCSLRRGNPREAGFHLKRQDLLERFAGADFSDWESPLAAPPTPVLHTGSASL